MAQGANSRVKSERFLIRWETATSLPEAVMRISISFWRLVTGSTGARATNPDAVIVISTGTLSATQVAMKSSGALQIRCPPRSWNLSSPLFPSSSGNSLNFLTAHESVSHDSRPNVPRNDQINHAIADPVTVLPAPIFNFLYNHRSIDAHRRGHFRSSELNL